MVATDSLYLKTGIITSFSMFNNLSNGFLQTVSSGHEMLAWFEYLKVNLSWKGGMVLGSMACIKLLTGFVTLGRTTGMTSEWGSWGPMSPEASRIAWTLSVLLDVDCVAAASSSAWRLSNVSCDCRFSLLGTVSSSVKSRCFSWISSSSFSTMLLSSWVIL